MTMTRGNLAVQQHAATGRALHLFKALGKGKGQKYVGEYACADLSWIEGPDRKGDTRKIVIFHLVPVPDLAIHESAADDDIRQSIAIIDDLPLPEDEVEFSEGKSATKIHIRRERSAKLRKELIDLRQKRGGMSCDLCATDGSKVDPAMRASMFECHHIIPLSVVGETKTKVKDMALLCANCHRLLHRAIANRKQWLSIEDAKRFLFI
jgi:5-methylcytosine-specific restriction protein A